MNKEQELLARLFSDNHLFLMDDILEYLFSAPNKMSLQFYSNSVRINTKRQSLELDFLKNIQEKFPSAKIKMIGNYTADIDVLLKFEDYNG